jgi:diguanylate cyclase (GGDEF)-like protein
MVSATPLLLRSPSLVSSELQQLLEQRALRPHFQPIVDLSAATVYAHESLIRGPPGSALATPAELFEAARRECLLTAVELECGRVAVETWSAKRAAGKLFVNFSAPALLAAFGDERFAAGMDYLASCGLPAAELTIELTEHDHVSDLPHLLQVVELLRSRGVQLALDDFGDGRSSLRLWSELRPDYVKIDRYFTRDVAHDANKLQIFRAMQQLAETFGGQLIAEGVESAAELRALRDLEVRYGQGWFLGRPSSDPISEPPAEALQVLRSRRIAILPELRRIASRRITVASLLVQSPVAAPSTSNDELFEVLSSDEEVQAIAIVEDGRPRALIDRQYFLGRYARPFFRELYGRRSCLAWSNQSPLLVEVNIGVESLTPLLTAEDQRYLREGFIIVDDGRYLGVGSAQSLVKAVTEARIEAARHANPLTLLPGNIPVGEHIERVLDTGGACVVAHADLNHFKAYNDYYGYWRGDEIIRAAAAVISTYCDPTRDFVGHVGGDDFVIVFQSRDWEARCLQIVREFNERALELFDASAREAGGIVSEDRHGERRFYPCTTISIGVARLREPRYLTADDVSAAAATAKSVAKQRGLGLYASE